MKNSFKESLNKYSKDRPWYINALIMIGVLLGSLIIPTILAYIFKRFTSTYVASILSDVVFIIILILIYYKDLKQELKNYKNNFNDNVEISIRYYFIGMMLMVTFNILLNKILGGLSTNETEVRKLLSSHTLYMMMNISIIAPIEEELVYRKSISTVFKNKWVYALISGILFGGAHILINIIGGSFVLSDLLYILPYGSIGFMFALMDHKTNSTITSMIVHALHNTFNAILLLYFL